MAVQRGSRPSDAENLRTGQEFRSGNLRGEYDPSGFPSWWSGTISPQEQALLRHETADYVVYSYAEPIAVRRSEGWYPLTSGRNSATTHQHRLRIWRALDRCGLWAPGAKLPEGVSTAS